MIRPSMAILAATGTARKRVMPAVRDQDVCTIVAIQARDPHKLAALASEFSVPYYSVDPEKMLDESKPDFVFIASPPALHRDHIQMCVDRSIPVICEKPLCLSASEASSIRSLIASRKIPFKLAHHVRHQPGILALREMISGNSFGTLRRVALQWGFWLNENSSNAAWKLDPSTGGPDCFYDAGIHAIDLMLYLLPPPRIIAAMGHTSRFHTTVDNVSALVLCGDAIVELSASQSIKCPLNNLTLDFEEATISVPHALSEKSFSRMDIFSPSGTTTKQFPAVNPYAKEIEDFIAFLNGQTSVGTSIQEACQSVQILDAITESYRAGQTVKHLAAPNC